MSRRTDFPEHASDLIEIGPVCRERRISVYGSDSIVLRGRAKKGPFSPRVPRIL